ncbi:SVM family protein ['Crotalaria aegyptiaca' phytoplasma]|uniref:SVM family protein n=1 Tax=Candidatus Phytoplasma crotalariae TaxID=2982627 RepID=A0ABT9D2W2_9MOLU|nr:SVM family protein ['Crotalaria aegyptiaca' phytoplasma]MDO8059380.1 SVM family protein ['Crotalaria aegyptiaca' phytoplasma]
MFKLSNQFKIISICLLFFVGLFLINNKKVYAFITRPLDSLNAMRQEIDQEIGNLYVEFRIVLDDMNLTPEIRRNRIREIQDRIQFLLSTSEMINQQIIEHNQPRNNQPRNNQPRNNQPRNNQPRNNQPRNNQPRNNN